MDVRRGNDSAIDLAEKDHRFVPVAVLDPRHVNGGSKEIERCAAYGVRLFRLFPDEHGYPWRYEPLQQIWRTLEQTQTIALITGTKFGQVTEFIDAVERYRFKRILVGCHYFYFTEFLSLLVRDPWSLMMAVAINYPNAYETLVQEIGAERVCFGSNAPIYAIGASLGVLNNAEISEEDRGRVLSGTLLDLLKEEE